MCCYMRAEIVWLSVMCLYSNCNELSEFEHERRSGHEYVLKLLILHISLVTYWNDKSCLDWRLFSLFYITNFGLNDVEFGGIEFVIDYAADYATCICIM